LMLLDCLKQAEVGQRMLLAWVSFLALPTVPSRNCQTRCRPPRPANPHIRQPHLPVDHGLITGRTPTFLQSP
jgi:hypothetical protein